MDKKFSKNFLPQEKFQKMVSDFSMINGLFLIFMTGAGLYLTPRVPHRQFLADASLTAFFADSRYSEFLDQKCLLSSNSISYSMVNSDFFCDLSEYCHNYELT